MDLDLDRLLGACADSGRDAGITIRAELEPLAGPGAPVQPAVYAGAVFQHDRRWRGDGDARRAVDAIVIDNVPSQANRLEAALAGAREELGLPEIVLDLSSVGPLPSHVPTRISSFLFPHRQADAYLRDATLDGEPFPKTEVGARILGATAEDPGVLVEWFPQALLFGFWQSHLGKKRTQAKLARSWVSEIVGYEPAVSENHVRRLGLKGDPLNLSVDAAVEFDPNDALVWSVAQEGGKAKAKSGAKRERLSEIGHGQVPVGGGDAALAAVSFAAIEQTATVSFASLRRIHAATADQSAALRALLVALGIVAHVDAFGRPFSLRSGCDLRAAASLWTWLGSDGDDTVAIPSRDAAIALWRSAVAVAEEQGLPVGRLWASEPLVVEPSEELAKVIRESWPLEW